MNTWVGMGRLTRDPQIKTYGEANDKKMARFVLAVDRRGKREEGQQNTDFITCVCYGKLADFADSYLRQGTKITMRGSVRTGSYEGKDGQTVYTTDVIADEVEFAESKRDSNAGIQDPRQDKKPDDMMPTPDVNTAQAVAQTADAFVHVDSSVETDLPFA